MERLKLATKQRKQDQVIKQQKSEQFDTTGFEQGFETMIASLTPEQIWQVGYEILAGRPVFERQEFSRSYVRELKEGGVNLSAFFVLLGINTVDIGELTPSDFGMLLRYFRLNNRQAFDLSLRALMRHPDIVRTVIVQLNKKQLPPQ